MSERVSEDDVRHIAALAKLGLAAARIPQLVRELNGILDHMQDLAVVDTRAAAEPFTPEALAAMELREDRARASVALERPLPAIAPEMRDGFFLVPRLATHEDSGSNDA